MLPLPRFWSPVALPTLAWRALFLLLLGVITTLALVPKPPAQISLGWDKLNHASAFATLAVVITLGWGRRWLRHALVLLAYGALIEVLQAMTATRSAEWADLLADGLGLTAGLLLVAGLRAASDRWRRTPR